MTKKLLFPILLVMMLFASCNTTAPAEPDTSNLAADILGVWCAPDGPQLMPDDKEPYYYLVEFTEDKMVLHEPSEQTPGYMVDIPYVLEDKYIILGEDRGAKAMVEVKDGMLTITDGRGSETYRHATIDEMAKVQAYPLDQDLFNQVKERKDELDAAANEKSGDSAETAGSTEESEAADIKEDDET